MSSVPSEAEGQAARANIEFILNFPVDQWEKLPAEVVEKHNQTLDRSRRVIQTYEAHHALPPTI